jgi:hypothetical protein
LVLEWTGFGGVEFFDRFVERFEFVVPVLFEFQLVLDRGGHKLPGVFVPAVLDGFLDPADEGVREIDNKFHAYFLTRPPF